VSRLVVYLAHPVAGQLTGDISPQDAARAIALNLERAQRWLRWLVDNSDHAIACPWMADVLALPEKTHRARGMRDTLEILGRCDAIVLVGGRISSGMQEERDLAQRRGLKIASLIGFGPEPPLSDPVASRWLADQFEKELS